MSNGLESQIEAFHRCIEQRDQALAETVLDKEYALVLVQPSRAVVSRDRWLAALPEYHVHSYEIHERVIDIDVDCAAVLHRATMKATVMGTDRSGEFIISDVWRLRDGTWRVWRRHSSPLTAGDLPITE